MIELKTYYCGFSIAVDIKVPEEEIKNYITWILKNNNIHQENLDFHECTKLKTEIENDKTNNKRS